MSLNLKHLSFENIEFLLQAYRLGSLTKAGTVLGYSPSAASRELKHIRAILGDDCFVFKQGKLVPTRYFNTVKPVLELLLNDLEKLSNRPFVPAECERTFRLTCMMAEAAHIVGGILPMMLSEAPRVRLHMSKHSNEFTGVLEGQCDFGIVTEVNIPGDVHTLKLYPIDRVVLMRKDHPLAKLERHLEERDLFGWDRVTIQTGRSTSWTGPDQNIFLYEKFLEHSRFTTSRFNLAWEAMEKTDLISICGFRAAEIACRQNNLTWRELPAEDTMDNIWNILIWSDITHRDPACVWLRRLFSRWAKEEEARVSKLIEQGLAPRRYFQDAKNNTEILSSAGS